MKTNSGLVAYAKAQIGLPYWNGTYGQIASESLYIAKKKQLPNQYTATDFPSQYGKRVHDCCGMVKGYLWSDTPTSKPKYTQSQDLNARGMYFASKEKGMYNTFPKKPGMLVYKASVSSKATTIHHVGIYIGDGYVIEAKGHAWGVIKSKYSKAWQYWSQHPDIINDCNTVEPKPTVKPVVKENDEVKFENLPVVKQGSKGTAVKIVQAAVGATIDGDFGPKTFMAVKKYQNTNKLTADGVVGKNTWKAILENLK